MKEYDPRKIQVIAVRFERIPLEKRNNPILKDMEYLLTCVRELEKEIVEPKDLFKEQE